MISIYNVQIRIEKLTRRGTCQSRSFSRKSSLTNILSYLELYRDMTHNMGPITIAQVYRVVYLYIYMGPIYASIYLLCLKEKAVKLLSPIELLDEKNVLSHH